MNTKSNHKDSRPPPGGGTVTIGGTVYYDGSAFQNGGDTYLATSPFSWSIP